MSSTALGRLLSVTLLLTVLAVHASAQPASVSTTGQAQPTVASSPQAYAVVVTGIPGTPLYARRFADWATRFHTYLTGPAGIPAANVTMLSGDKDFKGSSVTGQASAENVRKTLADLSRKVRADDQFILVLIGHGQAGDTDPALLVPGPALAARALAEDVNQIPSRTQVVLNFAGASGDMVRDLARAGRVNVAATGVGEEAEPVLAEFFLIGLTTKDGQVNMLEAYNCAARETAYWVGRQKLDYDESWIVEGGKSVEIFKKLHVGEAGDPGARKLSSRSDASAADVPVPPSTAQTDPHDPWWLGRRVLMEHPSLEDCGQELAVSAVSGIGYEPLDGVKDGQPGNLARRVVLGRPALLRVEADR